MSNRFIGWQTEAAFDSARGDGVDGVRSRHLMCQSESLSDSLKGAIHMSTITIGLDIAKHVFQVHGVDATGQVVIRKKLRRSEVLEFFKELPPSLVGMEACGTAHHWGRELTALGHDVRLMPAGYVKPYVKRGKNDAVDAEAICEAVTRRR